MAREMKDSGIEWIGEIPSNWENTKLKNIANIIRGGSPRPIDAYLTDSLDGYNWIKIGDTRKGYKYIDSTRQKIIVEGVSKSRVVHKGDLLLTNSMSFGEPYILNIDGCIHDGWVSFTECIGVDIDFLYYILSSPLCLVQFKQQVDGGVVQNLNINKIGSTSVFLPPPSEQKAIADFLDRQCAEIDAVIAKTKATIEEYKRLKQAVITEAITKGIRGDRPMKDSGIEWIGEIPAEWDVKKGKWILKRLERPVKEDDGVITCFRDGEVTLRSKRREEGFTFSLQEVGYQGIEPGDLVVHGMDGFAGAIGISDSRGKGTPVLNVLSSTENKRYIMYYLRNMAYNGIFIALATGIRVRSCDTNWNKLKELPYLIPTTEEQQDIADYLDRKCAEIDALIARKTALLDELEAYKKSVIYEYVTGKREVTAVSVPQKAAVIYPFFPVELGTDKPRFAQAVLMSRILDKCRTKMGRVKLVKMSYVIESSIGFDFDTEYYRQIAGPLDASVYECESIISQRNRWYVIKRNKISQNKSAVSYKPAQDKDKYLKYYDSYFADYDSEIERIIQYFMEFDAEQAEIVATLFGAWNDAIIDQRQFTDDDIVDDVLNNWNDSKTRIPRERWLRAMEHMRKHNIVPKGYGKRTVIKER